MVKRATLLLSVAAALILSCAGPALCLVDVNTASLEELDSLPGIGEVYAKRIIDGRPYRHIEDLKRLKGLGGKTFDKFKDLITVGAPAQAKKEAAAPEAKEAPAAPAAKQEPVQVPVYSIEKWKLLECHVCKNRYKVSGELKSGWCPYCSTKWSARPAASVPKEPPSESAQATGAVSP